MKERIQTAVSADGERWLIEDFCNSETNIQEKETASGEVQCS